MKTSDGGFSLGSFLVGLAVAVALVVLLAPGGKSRTNSASDSGRATRDGTRTAGNAESSDLESDDAPDVVKEKLLELKRRENEEWTAGNIRRYPIAYLEHCRTMMSSLREDLLDAQFGARLEKSRLERLIKEESTALDASRAFLSGAEAELSRGARFPVTVGDYRYDGPDFTNAVRGADATIRKSEKAMAVHSNNLLRADALDAFLGETLADLEVQIESLPLELETLRADEAKKAADGARDGIANLLDGVREISKKSAPKPSESAKKAESLDDIFKRNKQGVKSK